jgi:hypothetical protein
MIIIDGITITDYGRLVKNIEPNETNIRTLGGNLYTDFRNNLRSWTVSWENIKASDYQVILALYEKQYSDRTYLIVNIDGENVPAKIEISDQDLRYNKTILESFSVNIKEQFAFS